VDDERVLAILTAADGASSLPRLGGMARPDGVAIVSERIWCFSRVAGGEMAVRAMPQPPAALSRVPFLRGLVRVAAALVPLLGRGSAARPLERWVLAAAVVAPLPLLLVPAAYRSWLLVTATIALIAWTLRGRTLRLHGAEHRAIAAAEARSLVATWWGDARPTRFSSRCGTNLAALLIPVSLLLQNAWIFPTAAATPVLVMVVSLMFTMEIWLFAQRSRSRLARLPILPGLALQRLTTREPALADTRVALRAVAAVLQADGSEP
jgi:hypothetical protein